MKNVNIVILAIFCNIFFNTESIIASQLKYISAAVFKELHDGGDCGKGYKIHMEYTYGTETPKLTYDTNSHAYFLKIDMFQISDINSKCIVNEIGDHRYYDYIPIMGQLKTAFMIEGDINVLSCLPNNADSYEMRFNLYSFFSKNVEESYPTCYKAHSAFIQYMFYSDNGKDIKSPNIERLISYFKGESGCGSNAN